MIIGEGVRLRALEPTDLDRCLRWMNDPEVTEFLPMREPVSSMSYAKELDEASRGEDFRSRSYAIEVDGTGHVGNISLKQIYWYDRTAELTIIIGEKQRWDCGYGTEAVRTLLRHAFEELNLHRIWLTVAVDNRRAIRCYEKCGFIREGTLRDAVYRQARYQDRYLMSVLSTEFRVD